MVPLYEWSKIEDSEQRYQHMEDIRAEMGLSPYRCEDEVRLLLEIWNRQQ